MSQMHQIRFPASVCSSVRSFQTPSKRRTDGQSVRPSVRLLDGVWY